MLFFSPIMQKLSVEGAPGGSGGFPGGHEEGPSMEVD